MSKPPSTFADSKTKYDLKIRRVIYWIYFMGLGGGGVKSQGHGVTKFKFWHRGPNIIGFRSNTILVPCIGACINGPL